jgi:hypothetical protein
MMPENRRRVDLRLSHGEARENAAQNLLERKDATEMQKHKILYNGPVRFFGEP